MKDARSDFLFRYHFNFFKNAKHTILNELSSMIYLLPYELNKKYPNFALQTNEYIQASFFRENYSYINKNIDSSFSVDTGKKITAMIVLFPDELEVTYNFNFNLVK